MNAILVLDVTDVESFGPGQRQGDWTDDRVATLKTLWQGGLSASQLASRLGGVTRSAVLGKIHRLKLPGRDLPTPPRKIAERAPRIAKPRGRPPATTRPAERAPRSMTPSPPPPPPPDLSPTASLLTLTVDACRWPIGDPREANFGYCGRAREGHRLYCSDHVRIAFRQPAPARKRIDQPLQYLRTAAAGAAGESARRSGAG